MTGRVIDDIKDYSGQKMDFRAEVFLRAFFGRNREILIWKFFVFLIFAVIKRNFAIAEELKPFIFETGL
jgi:hypothetical protein